MAFLTPTTPRMRRATGRLVGVALALAVPVTALGCGSESETTASNASATPDASGTPSFSGPTNITNPYLPLSETPRVELRGTDDGAQIRTVRTLLDETEPFTVGGQDIEAAVVEDRAFKEGQLHEVAHDFYAQADDGTVYYLGEDVDYYEKGKVVGHEGQFRYGEDTDVLGVAMPADPKPGDEFSFEDIPDVGSERNRVATVGDQATIGGTSYDDVVAIEGRVLPDKEDEVKYYARDVGLIRETEGPDPADPESDVELVGEAAG